MRSLEPRLPHKHAYGPLATRRDATERRERSKRTRQAIRRLAKRKERAAAAKLQKEDT